MKKITFILIALIGLTTFAQKAEVKSAEKAFKKGDLATATEMIKKACQLKDQADNKTKAKIMYVKAQIFAKKGTSGLDNYKKAISTIEKLKAFEEKIGKKKYSDDADKILKNITAGVIKKVESDRNKIAKDEKSKANYANLAQSATLAYELTKDGQYKYIAAIANILSENFKVAEKQLQELYDSGFTGEKEVYTIKEKSTGKRLQVASEKEGKLYVSSGQYEDLKKEKTKSMRSDIVANLLYVYGKLGKDDDAIAFIQKAKKEDPNNVDLIIGEANYYMKKNDNKKFAEAMQRAVNIEPENKLFNYNLGIAYKQLGKYEEAKKYFNKVLEIDPNFTDAYMAITEIILMPEKEITDKMNQDEVLMNDALYNKYNKQRLDLYRQVLPVLEKALSTSPDDRNILIMLKKIYNDLEMKDKFNEVKNKLSSMGK